jgi:hypothetical protein
LVKEKVLGFFKGCSQVFFFLLLFVIVIIIIIIIFFLQKFLKFFEVCFVDVAFCNFVES